VPKPAAAAAASVWAVWKPYGGRTNGFAVTPNVVEEGLASVQLRRDITSGLAAQVGVVPGVVTELDLTRVDKGPQVVAMLRPGLAQMPAAPGRVTPLRQLSLPIVGVRLLETPLPTAWRLECMAVTVVNPLSHPQVLSDALVGTRAEL